MAKEIGTNFGRALAKWHSAAGRAYLRAPVRGRPGPLPGDRPNAMVGCAVQHGARTGIGTIPETLDKLSVKATFFVCAEKRRSGGHGDPG